MARCLRCGAGNEWIEGKVRDEPIATPALPDEAGEMVRRLRARADWNRKVWEGIDDDGEASLDHDAELEEQAASLIERLAPRWISMEERLPVLPDDPASAARVLVWTVKDGMGWIAVRFYRRPEWSKTHCEWWSGGDQVDGEIITHWQPLPNPPQKGST